MYFVTFDTCYPSFCSHWVTHTIKIIAPLLLADTVCHTSHSLLLLVQLNKLVTTAHEQTAIERAACWKLNICQFERVLTIHSFICNLHCVIVIVSSCHQSYIFDVAKYRRTHNIRLTGQVCFADKY